jgi:hypothetical protein
MGRENAWFFDGADPVIGAFHWKGGSMFWMGALGLALGGVAFGQERVEEEEAVPSTLFSDQELSQDSVVGLISEELVSPDDLISFPRMLRDLGNIQSTYAEYLRVAHDHPNSHVADLALYEAGLLDDMIDQSGHYRWASTRVRPSQRAHFLLLSQAAIYREGSIPWGWVDSESFTETMGNAALADWSEPQNYMLGWVRLFEGNDEAAIQKFGAIQDPDLQPNAQELVAAIESRDLPSRSVPLAGVLSMLVPGGGVIYAGDLEEGLGVMIVTGLSGVGTWYAYQDEKWVWTGLGAAGTLALYIKQISTSVKAARDFNDEQLWTWRDEIHRPNALQVELREEAGEFELEYQISEAN